MACWATYQHILEVSILLHETVKVNSISYVRYPLNKDTHLPRWILMTPRCNLVHSKIKWRLCRGYVVYLLWVITWHLDVVINWCFRIDCLSHLQGWETKPHQDAGYYPKEDKLHTSNHGESLNFNVYTGCPGGNVLNLGRTFVGLNSIDRTKHASVQSWTVTEIIAREKCGLLAVPLTVPI
jgi:hypothetical protein